MTASVTCSIVGDSVVARLQGNLVSFAAEGIDLTISFSEETTARRFADGINFASQGPEHSTLALHNALKEAADLADAVHSDATGGKRYRINPIEVGNRTFDPQVLSHNLTIAAAALFSAVADMDGTLSSIARTEPGSAGDAAALKAAACLKRARGPRREDQRTFFDLPETPA